MTIQEAIDIYNKFTGSEVTDKNIYGLATQAVSDILSVAELVEKQGGKLRSRQAIAIIIHTAKCKSN